MAFVEPVGVYFAHFEHTATLRTTGETLIGWLEEDPVQVSSAGFSPAVDTGVSATWECSRASWDALGIQVNDVLTIHDEAWRVLTRPRDRTVARVDLERAS